MLAIQDVCSSWLCSTPCPHTREGRECCPPDLCRQGSSHPPCLLPVTALGLAVRGDRTEAGPGSWPSAEHRPPRVQGQLGCL